MEDRQLTVLRHEDQPPQKARRHLRQEREWRTIRALRNLKSKTWGHEGPLLMKFEKKSQPLAERSRFFFRLAMYWLISGSMISMSLGIGVLGYHYFGHLQWIDALLNASMILTGMGPVDKMATETGKLFASFYALFSGVVFLSATAVVLSPVFHRVMHRFHLDDDAME